MKSIYNNKIQLSLSLLMLLATFNLAGQDLIRQPYLQTAWADSVSIIWKTDNTTKNCELKYSYTEEKKFLLFWKRKIEKTETKSGKLIPHAGAILNEVVLRKLKPGTKYQYEIYSNGKQLAAGKDYYFVTAPVKKGEQFSFFALGDIGERIKKKSFAGKAANQINQLALRPDFGLGLGDIVYPRGQSKVYDEQLFQPFENVFKNTPFYPVLGNHDWLSEPDNNFEKEWRLPNNEHYFDFEYSNAYFIGLDSRDGNFYDINNQTEWLKDKLLKAKGKHDWIIVYLHHNGKSCTYKKDYKHVIKLYKIFSEYGVDLVLNGHAHTYERLKPYNGLGEVAIENQHDNYHNLENAFVSVTIGAGGKLKEAWEPDTDNIENCADGNIVAHSEHVGSFSVVEIKDKKLILRGINSFTGEEFDKFEITK